MLFSICDYLISHREIPSDVSCEIGHALIKGYDIRNIYFSIPDCIPYMSFEGLTMKYTLYDNNQVIIIMEE